MNQSPSSKKIIVKLKKAAQCYSALMQNQYIIVYEGNYIEVVFNKKYFKHLTGISSSLNAKTFFNNSKSGKINSNQIFFDNKHPYQLCRKKLDNIINLEKSLHTDLLLLYNINTVSYIIPKGLTDLNFVLGLDVNNNLNGDIVNDKLVPYTIRVEGESAFNGSFAQYQIDYIFSKKKNSQKYSTLCFGDIRHVDSIPEEIRKLIDFNNLEIKTFSRITSEKTNL